ncbi:RIP metalloprotease RseP, partial [Oceanospirillum sp. HFRX-1_2]
YWVLFVSGTSALAPVVGTVQPGSLAYEAGIEPQAELISIDGEPVHSWQDAGMQLLSRVGDTGQIRIVTQEWQGYSQNEHALSIDRWLAGEKEPNPLTAIGVTPFSPHLDAVIGKVLPDGAAAQSGLLAGDQLLSVDGRPVKDWMHWVQLVQTAPDQKLALEIERDGRIQMLSITPRLKQLDDGREIGYIGAAPKPAEWPEGMVREVQYGVFASVSQAVGKTADMIVLTLDSIRKMIVGLISVDNLSGPITIAQVASDSAKGGFESFLTFLAYISISLGVLNLLPIPVLDGGHLLFYLIEAVTGRPVPEKAQQFGLRLGMMLLAGLMMIAFYNDLMRL